MKKSHNINFCITREILVITGFLIFLTNSQNTFGINHKKELLYNKSTGTYYISGKITDIATSTPVQNAKITLLNLNTRAVIYTDIFTDDNGNYEETLNIDLTGFDNEYYELPSAYYILKSYPSPLSSASDYHLTIQYIAPGNSLETPSLEMYNTLGSKVNTNIYLPAGVYFCRLKFKNDYTTDLEKIIMISGGKLKISLVQIFSKSGQKTGKNKALTNILNDTAKVIFAVEKSGYIYTERTISLIKETDNINNFALVQEGQKSSAEIDSTGGTVTVVNSRGDIITLTIPRYAIWNSTLITLTAFTTQPDNPIAKNIFPGVCITPAGLKLLQPATLEITFGSTSPDTNSATLFTIKQSDFILPIGNQTVTDSSINGEIYHFSEFIGGEPTADEATSQADKAGDMNPSDPYGWQDTYDCVDALLWWAEFYARNGRTEEGQGCFDDAKEIAERDAGDFLDLPIPDDPCGEYLTALLKYAELVMLLVGGDLEKQIQDKVIEVVNMCNLRGEIEYDHHVVCTDVDRSTVTRVTGNIPFYVNTLIEPNAAITGGGTAKVTINGPQEDCYLTASGIHRVDSITGELKADQQGIYWLEMTLHETWYESTTAYVTCPDPENNSHGQMPSFSGPTQVRFLVEDGWKYTMPAIDCDGQYQWILHIIHQP
jgi:hypothetical protein